MQVLRRLTPSRIALVALAIGSLIVAVRVGSDGRTDMSAAFAQPGEPCVDVADPSCGSVVSPLLPGDANCDGVINELDVPVLTSNIFDCNLCPSCPIANSDANCDERISVADLEALADPCSGEPTPTPSPGLNDCCQCGVDICQVPESGACPQSCAVTYDAACTDSGACVANTPTPTRTPTLGANDCCDCEGDTCSVPMDAACPQGCAAQYDSACSDSGACVANTPTPTRTPTLGANDCCQCDGVICAVPSSGACPETCAAVYDSACVEEIGCVANTVTPTPTPTLGANDCCVCEGNSCSVPADSACPSGCTPQYDSACLEAGCVANTPTQTALPTQTPTPTLGENDCCDCEGNTCSVPMDAACPSGCAPQYDSACAPSGACVANTPTQTPTPTLGANDCCQCDGNVCTVPGEATCPVGCTAQYDSACTDAGACVRNTPTPTTTRPPAGTRTRTPTMTPLVIPFPC